MLVETNKLVSAFKKVQQLHEHMKLYCLGGGKIPVCHKEVHWAIIDSYDHPIEVRRAGAGGAHVRALVLRAKKGAKRPHIILVSTKQAEDWLRFAQVKELSHILVDEAEDWSMDVPGTVSLYIYESGISASKIAPPVVQSEEIAMCVAMEILYPFDDRVHDAAELAAGKTSMAKLALHYDLPEAIVGRALNANYMKVATEVWGLVKGKKAA